MQAYIDEIKLHVTGGVLELEIDDSVLMRIVNSSMRELQRYICSTKIITLPYAPCIDLTAYNVNSVARVYRADASGVMGTNSSDNVTDPMAISLWQLSSNSGNMYNFSDYVSRLASYSSLQQVHNSISTDLIFYFQDAEKKLYINTSMSSGSNVTIEYVPRYSSVDEITSDFWIDVLMRLSIALTKVTLGRIRSRYTQSNALWQQDGATLLQEGQQELSELRNVLQKNTQLLYPID